MLVRGMRQVGRCSYSCIGICIRQGVNTTSSITLRFNWLLFITLILAQIDSYTLSNTSTRVSIRAYNGLHGSLFTNALLSLLSLPITKIVFPPSQSLRLDLFEYTLFFMTL
jgi:hypothetical protein